MQYDKNNTFALIISGQIKATKVYDDEYVIAFHDIHPVAPIHVLVLPKGEYCSFDDFIIKASAERVQYFYQKVRQIAHALGLGKSGYRLVMNHGKDAMQTVGHYHVHIIGKKALGGLIGNA